MLRYAITDATGRFAAPEARLAALRAAVQRWADLGVDFVQLREKRLLAGELFTLAESLQRDLRAARSRTKLLVNGRADVAVSAGCDGVHLTAAAGELAPAEIRRLFERRGLPPPLVSTSCHSLSEAAKAAEAGVDLILFGPVFEKVVDGSRIAAGSGLGELALAVEAAGTRPVLALGGVTAANTAACLSTGAAGVAGIRLFG